MLGLSQKKQFYTKFSLTFEFTVPSFSKLYLDQCHKFIVIQFFLGKSILRTSASFLIFVY